MNAKKRGSGSSPAITLSKAEIYRSSPDRTSNSYKSKPTKSSQAKLSTSKSKSSSSETIQKSQSLTMDDESVNCEICNKIFSEQSDKLLECERCFLWFCIKCVHISSTEYSVMARPDCHWYCEQCTQPAIQAVLSDKAVEDRCRDFLSNFESRLESLEKEMIDKASTCDLKKLDMKVGVLETRVDELNTQHANVSKLVPEKEATFENIAEKQAKKQVAEMEDRNRRKNNLIIFKLKEENPASADERKEMDNKRITEILSSADTTHEPTDIRQLGIFSSEKEGDTKHRPLRMTFQTEDARDEVLKSLRKATKRLTESDDSILKSIVVRKDLTPQERTDEHALFLEWKKKKEESINSGDTNAMWLRLKGKVVNVGRYPSQDEKTKEK